jgi:hypothetical protein
MTNGLSLKSNEFNTYFLKYFQRALILISIWTSILSIWIWVRALYFRDDLLKIWSFTLSDIPWTPPPTVPIPIIAGHYFGDFQLPVLLSSVKNPYDASWPLGGGPPLSYFIYKPFLIPSIQISFVMFLVTSICFFYFANHLLIQNTINQSSKFCVISLLMFVNLPFLVALDRGNFVVISTAMTGICFYYLFLRKGNELWYGRHAIAIFFVIAISIKVYLLCFLLPLWLLSKRGFVIRTVIYFFVLNTTAYIFINPKIDDILQSFKYTFGGQAGFGDRLFLMSGSGLPSFFSNLLSFLTDFGYASAVLTHHFYLFLFSIVAWYLLIIFLTTRKNLNLEIRLIWILSLIQFAPPVAMAYNVIWNALAAAILFKLFMKNSASNSTLTNKSILVLMFPIFLSLSFIPWIWWRLISPGAWIIAAILQIYLLFTHRAARNNL